MAKLRANISSLACDLQFVLLFIRNTLSILKETESKLHMKAEILFFICFVYGIDPMHY